MQYLEQTNKVFGISVTTEDGVVSLDQEQYINEFLGRFGATDCNTCTIPTGPG